MALHCGIVGLPNVGKSTLFNALTSAGALAANFPFATKDPNVGIITVHDERLQKLADIVHPKKIVPTTVEIVDIAGLIKGASQGEGLGNQFLANIREVDAIIHVVRCFDDDNVVHVDGDINPVRDKEIIDTELLLKDLETVERRIEKYKKQSKGGNVEMMKLVSTSEVVKAKLEEGIQARIIAQNKELKEAVDDMMLLTAKPILYVCNVDESAVVSGNAHSKALASAIAEEEAEILLISADIEAELTELNDEERREFLTDMGLKKPGVHYLTQAAYTLLDLITYFTAGEKEVRAWTVTQNTKAPQAAGVIHSDFEKGFIRAEVIHYSDFIQYNGESGARDAGKLALEGKDYVILDGDVVHFRFNV